MKGAVLTKRGCPQHLTKYVSHKYLKEALDCLRNIGAFFGKLNEKGDTYLKHTQKKALARVCLVVKLTFYFPALVWRIEGYQTSLLTCRDKVCQRMKLCLTLTHKLIKSPSFKCRPQYFSGVANCGSSQEIKINVICRANPISKTQNSN